MKWLLPTLMFAGTIGVHAQNEIDALRYGQLDAGATARALGLGGAGGSYGGDYSSLSINPAGLGVYRSSEITLTPVLRFGTTKGTYLGTNTNETDARFNLNNFGLVFTTAAKGKDYESSKWKAFSIGLGYNRLADFNDKVTYTGLNTASSITDIISEDALANGVGQDLLPPLGFLGYYGFLLYDDFGSIPRATILDQGGALQQTKSWTTGGGVNEWNLSLGGNYNEKLMLGIGVNLLNYKYDRTVNFYESDQTGNVDNDFDYLSYNEYLTTTGLGVNLKFGLIYVANDLLRLGVSIHTPTWAGYNDIIDYDLTTNTENLKLNTGQDDSNPVSFVQPDAPYRFDYSLRTPWRGVLSATVFMGQHGFVTADYEYVGYNAMSYSFQNDREYQTQVNNAIKETFKGGHNIRLGIEGRMDNFLGRAGFAYHTSPFKRAEDFGGSGMDLSLGLGARFGAFFADLAYVHRIRKQSEFAYPLLSATIPNEVADLRYGKNLVALTVGFKF